MYRTPMLKRACVVGVVMVASCSRCKSPLDDTPAPIAALPAGRGVVVAFDEGSSRAFVVNPVDAAHGKTSRWTATDALFAGPGGPIRGAWWRPGRERIFVRAGSGDVALLAIERGGRSERVLVQSGAELAAANIVDACAVAPDASTLVCWGQQAIEGAAPARYRTTVRLDALVPGTPPRVVRWNAPVAETGAFAPLGDASAVLYSDRCSDAEPGASCLYRATNAGETRARVATLPGSACVIEPSPDGRRVAVASRVESYDRPCSELNVTSLEPGQRAPVRTSLLAAGPSSYRGIGAIAWSPDGSQIVVTSDHAEGCSGSMGVTVCKNSEYVVDAATPGGRAVGTYAHEGSALVWLPPGR